MLMRMILVPIFCRALKLKMIIMMMKFGFVVFFSHCSRPCRKREVEFVRLRLKNGTNWPVPFRSDYDLNSMLDFPTQRYWKVPNVRYFCCCWFQVAGCSVKGMACSNAIQLSPKISFRTNSQFRKIVLKPPVRSVGNFPIVLNSIELLASFLVSPISEQSMSVFMLKMLLKSSDIVPKNLHFCSVPS